MLDEPVPQRLPAALRAANVVRTVGERVGEGAAIPGPVLTGDVPQRLHFAGRQPRLGPGARLHARGT